MSGRASGDKRPYDFGTWCETLNTTTPDVAPTPPTHLDQRNVDAIVDGIAQPSSVAALMMKKAQLLMWSLEVISERDGGSAG
jgi:hypothetical protein